MLLTSTGSRLLRLLLSLVIRFRLSVGRIALALRARLAALWRSTLAFAPRPSRGGPCQLPLDTNNVPPAVVGNNPTRERLQNFEDGKVEDGGSKTLAALPVHGSARREEEFSKHQALVLSDSKIIFEPTTPEKTSQRYESRIVDHSSGPPNILAGQQALLKASPKPSEGWERYIHPEGSILFWHGGLRIFTESDSWQPKEIILSYAKTLFLMAKEIPDVILDDLTEIVLNVDDKGNCRYYFVDHTNRLLFWVHPVKTEDLGTHLQGISQNSHIRYLIEAQYWSHCEYYPHDRILPRAVFEDLRRMLNCAKTDMMTTDSSTSPFAQDELVAILDIVNSLKDDKDISDPSSIWVIARLTSFFTENKFLNFYGQPCARLDADTSLLEKQPWDHSKLFRFLNVFLFGSPIEHAVRLQRVWVDGIIIQPRWKDFISRLTTELGRYTIFSTVMLAVNFSFLAVPGVVTIGAPASTIQIIIYCSVVATTGSIVFSFALLNVYSDPGLMDAGPAAEVMKILSQMPRGMAGLAVTHSLPMACLVWSITFFSVALAIQIFSPKERATVATLGVECFILVLFGLIGYLIMRLFSKNDDVDDEDAPEEDEASSPESQDDDAERDLEKGRTSPD